MKKILKKFIISIIIIITIISGITGVPPTNYVQADDISSQNDDNEFLHNLGKAYLTEIDGLVGILVAGYRVGAYSIITIVRGITALITAVGGGEPVWSIEGIIFTGVKDADGKEVGTEIVSVDFFDTTTNTTVNTIRQNVAIWYYALRNLAIVISVGILIYVGIRMAISTVAEEQAKYKKMIKDWVVSLVLIFLLHYIMIFTIELNNTFVTILYNAATNSKIESAEDASAVQSVLKQNGQDFKNAVDIIAESAFDPRFTVGVANLIVYGILVGITIIYLFMYIKRMLTVGFLIVIAPLITITYSIDRIGDGKSQALNTWLKEFIYNVLIQTFHCIIYIVFVNVAIKLMAQASLAASILAVLMILFMHQAEEMIKNIFNFNSKSLASAIGSTAIIATGINFMKKQGDKAAKKGVDSNKIPEMKDNGAIPEMTAGGANNATPSNNAQNNINNAANGANGINGTAGTNGVNGTTGANGVNGATGADAAGTNGKQSLGKKLLNRGMPSAENFKRSILGGAALGMGMIGAATGDYKGAASGFYAGNSMKNGVENYLDRRKANKQVEQNEQVFAAGFEKFAASKRQQGWSEQKINAYTQQLVTKAPDISKMENDEVDFYTNYVQPMKQSYEAVGESDVGERFKNTVKMIRSGDITPVTTINPQASNTPPSNTPLPNTPPSNTPPPNTPDPGDSGSNGQSGDGGTSGGTA